MRVQLARQRSIGLRIRAARSCACDWTRRDQAVAHAHEPFGRRTDDRDAIQHSEAAERSWIGLAQAAIDLMRLDPMAQRRLPAARKIRLIDVARTDVFQSSLD